MPAEDKGLTSKEARERLLKFGRNILPEKLPPGDFVILLLQLKNPLVYILLAAALITIFLARVGDTIIILLAVLINTILGFWQESKASKALIALRQLIVPHALVIRDGKQKKIPRSEIVPGDIVVLVAGEGVPGDGEVIESVDLFINEATLTGESQSVQKQPGSKVFMGTVVAGGRGVMRVLTTGSLTEVGKIAQAVGGPAEQTPLRRQLHALSKRLAALVGVLTVFVFTIGIFTGRPVIEMFLTAVALAVSAIPEGLLISTTAVLAIGMTQILKRKGLVRRLLAAETLGGVTVICVDKTGTLTQGSVRVVGIEGDENDLVKTAILCNNLHDPLEVAMFEWAENKLKERGQDAQFVVKECPRVDELPFSNQERYQATLCQEKSTQKQLISVMGAPEVVLKKCKVENVKLRIWEKRFEEYGKRGYRMVGFANRRLSSQASSIEPEDLNNLSWIGVLLFEDPVRAGVKEALDEARKAGVAVKVITGDYPATALHVLAQLGRKISSSQVMLGDEIGQISTKELDKKIGDIVLFARTSPAQKLLIVEALKIRGEVVAMTGDGVNDAPALSRADIGIVVGDSSDVARESADLVLLDSNFATILAAIEEGRGIFDNLRKIVLYLLSDAFGEITAVVGTILLALPLPLTAAQILWINLISDGFPNLALTVDPKRRGLMQERPRNPQEQVVTKNIAFLIATVSVFSGLLGLLVFIAFFTATGDLQTARSVAFLTLGVNSLLYVFSVRNLGEFIWKDGWLTNKWLLIAVCAGFLLQALPFYIPFLREFFGVSALSLIHWGVAITTGIVVVFFIEVSKFLFFRR